MPKPSDETNLPGIDSIDHLILVRSMARFQIDRCHKDLSEAKRKQILKHVLDRAREIASGSKDILALADRVAMSVRYCENPVWIEIFRGNERRY
jgi:hypothetical protein